MTALVSLRNSKGNPVVLGSEIGRGGEGGVYEVDNQPHMVAKIYATPPDRNHAAKLLAMVAAGNERISKLAAWPTDLVNNRGGSAIGFLMPKVVGFKPVFELYGPKLRLKQFPKADWRFLVRAASNIARAFSVVHAMGHVIGDVNHGNLVVGQDATVRLIDCDSFQISSGGQTWFCEVGVPTHQPPEMQGLTSYARVIRTANHDAFGLAVLIFQMLCLARHPFSGRFLGSGDPPSIEDAIRQFRYAYGGDSRTTQMAVPPGSLPIGALTPEIRRLFDRAFLHAGAQMGARPTPAQWVSALADLAAKLRQCGISASHYYLSSLPACPWCDIESKSNTLFFPVTFVAGHTGVDGFMLLWQQVEAAPRPGPRDKMPEAPKMTPSDEARIIGRRLRRIYAVLALTLGVSAVAIQEGVRQEWRFELMVSLAATLAVALFAFRVSSGREIKRRLNDSRSEWRELQRDWMSSPRSLDPESHFSNLEEIKRSYNTQQSDRMAKLQKLHENRRASQLVEYLDRFQIAGAKVRGVGQAKAAVLQSYGIETAADVEPARVIVISGFGPKTVQNLVDWRRGLERNFKFDPSRGISPADIGLVENAFGLQRRVLEQRLSIGLAQFRAAVAQEMATRADLRSRFQAIAPAFGQAAADGRALGVRV